LSVRKQHTLLHVNHLTFRSPWLIGLATEVTAVTAAGSYVAAHDGFGRNDLAAMATWSVPLAVATATVTGRLARRRTGQRVTPNFLLLLSVGALIGIVWSIAAALLLGAWIAAFSFPVLICWVAASAVGASTAASLSQPRSWAATAVVAGLVALGMQRVDRYRPAPEAAVRVVLRPNATVADVDRVWTTVLGRRTGRGDEHNLLPSLSSVSVGSREGSSPVLLATFGRGTSERTQDSVVAQIRRSPLVLRVDPLATR